MLLKTNRGFEARLMFESMFMKTEALSVSVPLLLIINSIGCFEAPKLIKQEWNCPILSFVAMLLGWAGEPKSMPGPRVAHTLLFMYASPRTTLLVPVKS